MRMNEIREFSGLPIDGYGPGFFRVAGTPHPAPLAVMPSGVVAWTGYDDPAPLVARADEIDILFVGTGRETRHVPAAFRTVLEEAGVGVEFAASPSACRTYNVLLSEGRRVGIALMPI